MRDFFLNFLSVFKMCGIDVWFSLRSSFIIPIILLVLYAFSFLLGLYVALEAYDYLETLLFFLTFPIPFPIDLILDILILLSFLLFFTGLACSITRKFLYFLSRISNELGLETTFAVLAALSIFCFCIASYLAIVFESSTDIYLELLLGVLIMTSVFFLSICAWLYLRYMWSFSTYQNKFQRDISAVISHFKKQRKSGILG